MPLSRADPSEQRLKFPLLARGLSWSRGKIVTNYRLERAGPNKVKKASGHDYGGGEIGQRRKVRQIGGTWGIGRLPFSGMKDW